MGGLVGVVQAERVPRLVRGSERAWRGMWPAVLISRAADEVVRAWGPRRTRIIMCFSGSVWVGWTHKVIFATNLRSVDQPKTASGTFFFSPFSFVTTQASDLSNVRNLSYFLFTAIR